ncbi:hypothetical protein PYW07_005505 [Mythimna separata]|uniref:Pyroglutamyl-peptidase I n=1 Tax=Mythimna separata TaxID=271217 RepID=A0AAD7YJL4_MYTSE|nr:hypothetical protein PYW07_005505 [Mythimna separata]
MFLNTARVIDDILNDLKYSKPKRVLITGFGPFGEFKTNPSWQAVEAMDTGNINTGHEIILYKEKVGVRYVDVDLNVPRLLDIRKPHLTIHVGVSKQVTTLRLEVQANKHGYKKYDSVFRKAARAANPSPGPDSIATSFDVAAIQNEFNEYRSEDDLPLEISKEAGLYLCEYIYYTSLSHARSPTLFVHVPPHKEPEKLARGLERIVELCLKQLHLAELRLVSSKQL